MKIRASMILNLYRCVALIIIITSLIHLELFMRLNGRSFIIKSMDLSQSDGSNDFGDTELSYGYYYPTVYAEIINPEDGRKIEDAVTIIVKIGGSAYDIEGYLHIDGECVKTWYSKGKYYYAWDASGLSGYHTIKLTVIGYYLGEPCAIDRDSVTVEIGDTPHEIFAVIVGISDYKTLDNNEDLEYADDDLSDWFSHLTENLNVPSSHIRTYSDMHTSAFAVATEYNVKQGLEWLIGRVDGDDTLAFISIGHGGHIENTEKSFLCMWDYGAGERGEDGKLYDYELAGILKYAVAKNIFVFLSHCYSGGFGDDLMNLHNSKDIYLTTTCTADGKGYEEGLHQNSLWTYYFLEYSWQGHYDSDPQISMEAVFDYAHDHYPFGGNDEPQEYDGNTSESFRF
ncbi:MAG: hypothetical protein ACTSU6_03450 [Candidatus Njordarchaeales archaeon]